MNVRTAQIIIRNVCVLTRQQSSSTLFMQDHAWSRPLTSISARSRIRLAGRNLGRISAQSISSPLSHPPASLYPHTTSNYLRKPQICCHGEYDAQLKSESDKRAKRPLRKVTSCEIHDTSINVLREQAQQVRSARSFGVPKPYGRGKFHNFGIVYTRQSSH